MKLFEWSLRMKGFDIAFAKAELKRIQATAGKDYMDKAKINIVNHHKKYNLFYQGFTGKSLQWEWESLPIMTKANLQQPLKKRLSEGYEIGSVYKGKTSGSSGHPFTFAKNKFCHALSWASFIDRYQWFDLDLNTSKQARFYGIPLDTFGYYKERMKDWLGNRYRFAIFDLSESELAKVVSTLEHSSFEYINGYTSSIVLFAKYLKKKKLVLTAICPSIKVCIVTSEMLFEDDKLLMEQQFNVPIINEYGASELGLIAFQNNEGDFQVDDELLFVEILNDEGKVVPDGEVGRIVVTALYNKAHPFIRYEIGDMGAITRHKSTGKLILSNLQGRTSDIAILPSGKVVPGLTFYYVTKSVIEESGDVSEFVIEQSSLDTFKFIYKSKKELSTEEKQAIKEATYKYLEKGLTVQFERVETMDRSYRGKLKQFSTLI